MSFCSNCGKETIPGDLYCEGCGIRYDQFENQLQNQSPEKVRVRIDEKKPGKKQGKVFRKAFILILVVALAAGAYYIKTNKPFNTLNSTGNNVDHTVAEHVADNNGQAQPTSKPAETVAPPQEPVAAPSEVKKEKTVPAANTPESVVPSKKTLPAKSPDIKQSVVIFSTWNNNGLLLNNPLVERIKWNITKKVMITRVTTYHWNGGKGDSGGGTLTFTGAKNYGPFRVVRMEAGEDGTPNAKWVFEPGIILSPGKYKIEQTGKRTLSHNVGSAGQGFVKVEGYYTGQ